jgi:hypothetical protein
VGTTEDIVEVIGSLVSALKSYASKLPSSSALSNGPSAIKPSPEAVARYEEAVLHFRHQVVPGFYRGVHERFIESLEAFEGGRLLGAIQPLLMVLDHMEVLVQEKTGVVPTNEAKRLQEYRSALNRILPGNQPELEGAGKGL